jgi:hypothetical protein
MIIDIEDELFYKIKELMKHRSKSIYEQLKEIKPLEAITTDTNTLQQARAVKTQRVKQSIKETIKSLYNEDISPTRYQLHKRTGIAYITLNKYYDDILNEVKKVG